LISRIPVTSSSIKSIGYGENQVLEVEFLKGDIYIYNLVEKEVFEEFIKTSSKGRFYIKHIKGKYPSEKKL
jgi:hypothetical protein